MLVQRPRCLAVLEVVAANHDKKLQTVELRDNGYGRAAEIRRVAPGDQTVFSIDTRPTAFWYDFSVGLAGDGRYAKRYAGRVETGQWSTSDPAMGRGTR